MAPGGGRDPLPLPGAELLAIGALWKRSGRELVVQFGGSSMLPAIPPATDVVLRCDEEAGVGDVIAFVDGDRLVVHRILARSDRAGWLLTCGDASSIPDPPFADRSRIVGRVLRVRQGDGFVPVPAAPAASWRRRALRRLSVSVLHRSEALGRALLAVLRVVRRTTRLRQL